MMQPSLSVPLGAWVALCRQPSNNRINRSAQQLRCRVPVALRAPAPGYAERWTDGRSSPRHFVLRKGELFDY